MRGKIALEEHVSTPENNRLWIHLVKQVVTAQNI